MSRTPLAAMLLMLLIEPTASAGRPRSLSADSPATSNRLGLLPPNGLHMVLDVTYEKPGSVVDTGGIAGAWV